jgi:hypothetical protein
MTVGSGDHRQTAKHGATLSVSVPRLGEDSRASLHIVHHVVVNSPPFEHLTKLGWTPGAFRWNASLEAFTCYLEQHFTGSSGGPPVMKKTFAKRVSSPKPKS